MQLSCEFDEGSLNKLVVMVVERRGIIRKKLIERLREKKIWKKKHDKNEFF